MKQIALFVYVNLDPVPGAFYTPESALANTRGILEGRMGHYEPQVAHAPDHLQPESATRVALVVYVKTDPSLDKADSKRFALRAVRQIMRDAVLHYNPVITYAPRELQPDPSYGTGAP